MELINNLPLSVIMIGATFFSLIFSVAIVIFIGKLWEQLLAIGNTITKKEYDYNKRKNMRDIEQWARCYCFTVGVDFYDIQKIMLKYKIDMLNKQLIKKIIEYQQKKNTYPHKRYSLKRIIGK